MNIDDKAVLLLCKVLERAENEVNDLHLKRDLLDAIELLSVDRNKGYFEISSVHRDDIISENIVSEEVAMSLSDSEMQDIASCMGDAHTEGTYWSDLKYAVNHILEHRNEI
jgi:hypothetical protein